MKLKTKSIGFGITMAALLTGALMTTTLQAEEGNHPLKGIALGGEGGPLLDLGGSARIRWENFENFGFSEANDDDFLLYQMKLNANLKFSDSLRLFVEGKSALASDRDLPGGRRTLDVDELDLQQAYLELALPLDAEVKTLLRLGRQELALGKQRLISPLGWSNTRRAWDGAVLNATQGEWVLTALYTQFAPVDKYAFNEPDSDIEVFGLYTTRKDAETGSVLDLYWLGTDIGMNERFTTGARIGGACGDCGLDFDTEGAWQYGDDGESDVEAWMVAAQIGYKIPICPFGSRVYVGYDYATGDDNPEDGKVKTFSQLQPLGHAYFGFIDSVARQNIQDFSQGIALWPIEKKVMLKVDHHFFQRAEREDALYHAGAGVVRAGDAGSSREIGTELDVTLKWVIDSHTALQGGYSRLFAGDFIEESAGDEAGKNEDIEFLYTSLQYSF